MIRFHLRPALALAGLFLAASATSAPARPAAPLTVSGGTAPRGAATDTCLEDFDDAPALYASGRWLREVNSGGTAPFGGVLAVNWDYGIDTYGFGSQSGRPGSYVAANHLSAGGVAANGGGETASTWLVTPEIEFQPGNTLSFYTRSIWSTGGWPDRLYVRLCTDADCGDVGDQPDDVGGFTTTLLAINPNLVADIDPTGQAGYPIDWTPFTVTLPDSGRGRVAFHYHVTDVEDFFAGVGHNGTLAAVDTVALRGNARCPFRPEAVFDDDFERVVDPRVITQNADVETIVGDITPSCFQAPTSWLRRFDLAGQHGLSGQVTIDAVDFGIDVSRSNQRVSVRLYSIARGADLLWQNMTVIGSALVPVGVDDDGIVKRAAVTGTVPDAAAQDLVVEVNVEPYGSEFFLGANTAPQTGPSYIAFPGGLCGLPGAVEPNVEPTDIGPHYPDTHLLMVVHRADTADGAAAPLQ